ncbi:hypothetical protein AB0M36_30610 [Actinoplanes sp. NPDC051346]|uniref:hypothetical protein n=1 Tax=Actinoplanes sp. NPDC051346 TaxID=3155048 RepID=UPI00343A97DA
MKIKLPSLVTVVGTTVAALAASLCTPVAASAAAVTGPQVPKYVMSQRDVHLDWETGTFVGNGGFVAFTTVAGADYYEVLVTNGTNRQFFKLTPDAAHKAPGSRLSVNVAYDQCTDYTVSVTSRNSLGQSAVQRLSESAARPGGIRAASAKRGTDPTTATFTWTPPANWGFFVDKYATAAREDKTLPQWRAAVYYQVELVRMADNRVVQSKWVSGGTDRKAPVTFNATGLTAKGAYMLRVSTQNDVGGCGNKTGKILLNKVK